ncbi:MAG: class I SAM-dependent methyltransferase, partial [Bacteroidota bacterium]
MADSHTSYDIGSYHYEITTTDELWKIPLSSTVFLKPNPLPRSPWIEHIPYAFWLIDAQRPNLLVELGTHFGLPYFAFCQAVQTSGLQTKCYAIDNRAGNGHTGFYNEPVIEFAKKTNEQYSSFSTLVRSSFDEALSFFEDKSIDLLHLDGRHTYEAVRHDFYTWLPKMSERGIVLFHDTTVKEGNFGVFRLWEELSKKYPSFEFQHASGLGVLGVGTLLPEKLKTFFEVTSTPGMGIAIRQVYQRLGALIKAEQTLEEQKIENNKLQLDHKSALKELFQVQQLLNTQLNAAKQTSSDCFRKSEDNKRSSDLIIQGLETKLTQRTNELLAFKKALNDLTGSMTWKITTPIRMTASKFPKLSIFIKRAGRVLWWTVTLRLNTKLKERDYSKKLEGNILKIKRSGLFDIKWYFEQYPDVRSAGVDPVRHYLEFGAKEGRNPNPLFDTRWYLRNNKDVADSGANAFIHFIEFGALESRSPHPDYDRISYVKNNNETPVHGINPMSQLLWFQARNNNSTDNEFEARDPSKYNNSPQIFSGSSDITSGKSKHYSAARVPFQLYKVIYVSGFSNSPSHNLRVNDQIEALNHSGISATWIDSFEVLESSVLLTFAEIIVLFRVATDPVLEQVIASCKKAGVLIAYDTDDYVFDPKVANAKNVDGLRFLNKEETAGYHTGVHRYRDAMKLAQVGIFSTEMLADAGKQLGLNTFIIKNGLSEEIIETSSKALKLRNKHRHLTYIGYASGTLTHQRDFSIVAPVIAKILHQFPHVRLKIIGLLKIEEFPELEGLEEQIEVHGLVPQHRLPYEIVQFDINIAPLEIGNPFCEAKSELKYFEAALLNVPTVASATAPYRRAITNSENGFLAVTEEDWYEALLVLIKNKALREEIGQRAYAHSMANYGVASKKNEVIRVFNTLLRIRRQELLNKRQQLNQTITIMTCPFEKGGGGHAIIIDMAKWLSKWGHSIVINFTGPTVGYP